jgi:diacylglycerol kinase family enzyme
VDAASSRAASHAAELARQAYQQGYRRFIAVGGDGTANQVVNGVFPLAAGQRFSLGLLPLGTGNSFLRDFTSHAAQASFEALAAGRKRAIDLLRLTHSAGEVFSLNLLSLGFTADVGALTNRLFKPLGHLGYLLGVFVRVIQLRHSSFAIRCDDDRDWDARRCLFLTFNNTKYTGGTMLIAPFADPADGQIEFVRLARIGRLNLLRNLPKLYDGAYMKHPLVSRRAVRHVEFRMAAPVDVMIDGEIAKLECRTLDVLPGALDIYM